MVRVRIVIRTEKLRTLKLDKPTRKDRLAAIAAASGLVCVKSFLYVIADDEKRKFEGVCIVGTRGARKILLVNDEDNPEVASELRRTDLPIGFL